MTRDTFNNLQVDEEFEFNKSIFKVKRVYPIQGIISGYDGDGTVPFRYEDCMLVETDKLKIYLRSDRRAQSEEEDLKNIRSIVMAELTPAKKDWEHLFPELQDYRAYKKSIPTAEEELTWFINRTKSLNS